MQKRGVQIERNTARALFEVGREVQQRLRNPLEKPGNSIDYPVAIMFLTTTTLTRMSGATPGYGSAKMQQYGGPGNAYSDATETIYTIINSTAQLWASGAYVLCVPGPDGYYHAVITSCSNITQ